MTAFFISPQGEVIVVPVSHIDAVIHEPHRFGVTMEEIKEIYNKYNEKLGVEAKARAEILKKIIKQGWIRIRKHKNHWTVTLEDIRLEKMIFLQVWAKEVLQKDNTDKYGIVRLDTADKSKKVSLWDIANGKKIFIEALLTENQTYDCGLIVESVRNYGARNRSLSSRLFTDGYRVFLLEDTTQKNQKIGYFIIDIKNNCNLERYLMFLKERLPKIEAQFYKAGFPHKENIPFDYVLWEVEWPQTGFGIWAMHIQAKKLGIMPKVYLVDEYQNNYLFEEITGLQKYMDSSFIFLSPFRKEISLQENLKYYEAIKDKLKKIDVKFREIDILCVYRDKTTNHELSLLIDIDTIENFSEFGNIYSEMRLRKSGNEIIEYKIMGKRIPNNHISAMGMRAEGSIF